MEKFKQALTIGIGKACRHPYILIAVLCMIAPFGVIPQNNTSVAPLFFYAVILLTLLAMAAVAYLYKHIRVTLPLMALYAIFTLAIVLLSLYEGKNLSLLAIQILSFLAAYAVILRNAGELTNRMIALLITIAAFALRLMYVYDTPITDRQHDIGNFATSKGSHTGYIKYFYEQIKLPDFDVRTRWQFYQPPLHYLIEALWLRFQTLIGVTLERAYLNVQFVTLFYSTAATVTGYKILRELRLKGGALYVAYALIAFHPTMTILAASFNNDMLSVLFMINALLFAIRWYRNPTYRNTVPLALCTGLGMMSKLSAVYIAPAIGFLLLRRLITSDHKLAILTRCMIFGVISIPLGVFWSVYNYLKFGVPLGYVPRLGSDLDQYIGGYSVFDRIFNVYASLKESIFFARGEKFGYSFNEFNIPGAIIKTSMFGEWRIGGTDALAIAVAGLLLYSNIFIITISLVAMGYFLVKKIPNLEGDLKAALYIFHATILFTYVRFCFTHPHDCTMDFRYIVPTLYIGAIFIGFLVDRIKQKPYIKPIYYLTSVFCMASAALYIMEAYV